MEYFYRQLFLNFLCFSEAWAVSFAAWELLTMLLLNNNNNNADNNKNNNNVIVKQ